MSSSYDFLITNDNLIYNNDKFIRMFNHKYYRLENGLLEQMYIHSYLYLTSHL